MTKTPADISVDTHVEDETIPGNDRQVLRRLAGRVGELAGRDIENHKKQLWTDHNDLEGNNRPLIFCDPENGWKEIITEGHLECQSQLSRQWEFILRKEVFWGESMCDDRVIQGHFDMRDVFTCSAWGLSEVYSGGENGGAKRWDSPITDIDDLSGLKFQTITVDPGATARDRELADSIFGDLLPIRRRNTWYWTLGLTQVLIKLRGLENMMLDMYDNPQGLHNLLAFLRDGTLDTIDFIERENLYTLNNEGDYVGSGGFGWTSQLPGSDFDGRVRASDLWCLSESQETVGVSPEMFGEFVFPYQLPIVERFGLICYGCCEPIDSRWHIIKQIPNLRRVSVSPWCDRAKMAEYLGGDYVYSLKPHPGLLAGASFDPDAVRADIRDALTKTAGCRLEIIMKDNNTIRNDPARVIKWVQIARQEIDKMF